MEHARAKHDRLLALDGLRGLSVLLVCYSHIVQLLHARHLPGTYGVTIFFFISGFIITRLLLAEADATASINLSAFYVRRWFRLTPALMVYVLACVLVLVYLGRSTPGSDVMAVLFYYSNYHAIFTQFATVHASGGKDIASPFIITWSLAVEEHFYLLFPLLLLGLRKRTDLLLAVLVGFVIATLGWRVYLAYGVGEDALAPLRIYQGTDTRLDSIAYGCILSIVLQRSGQGWAFGRHVLQAMRGYRGVAFAGVLFVLSMIPKGVAFKDSFAYSMQGVSLFALLASLYSDHPARLIKSALENRWLVYFGSISYSLYLYHYLAFVVVQIIFVSAFLQVPLAWLLGLFGAVLSHHFIEGPARRMGGRLEPRLRAVWAAYRKQPAPVSQPVKLLVGVTKSV